MRSRGCEPGRRLSRESRGASAHSRSFSLLRAGRAARGLTKGAHALVRRASPMRFGLLVGDQVASAHVPGRPVLPDHCRARGSRPRAPQAPTQPPCPRRPRTEAAAGRAAVDGAHLADGVRGWGETRSRRNRLPPPSRRWAPAPPRFCLETTRRTREKGRVQRRELAPPACRWGAPGRLRAHLPAGPSSVGCASVSSGRRAAPRGAGSLLAS